MIDKGGKRIPHVGEIMGLCQSAQSGEDTNESVHAWVGVSYEEFEKMSGSVKRLWSHRWQARCEAKLREAGRAIHSSHFDPEPLDDVLTRLGMDMRGNLIERDFLGRDEPTRVEDHTPYVRDSGPLIQRASALMRERMDAILLKHERLKQERELEPGWQP